MPSPPLPPPHPHPPADLSEQKWNGPAGIFQSALILWETHPFVEGGGGNGGGGCWQWIFFILLVFASSSSVWHMQCLVWQWAFTVLLADQHWKQSCLARASTCCWTQGTDYLQQVNKMLSFSQYVVPVTLFLTGTRGTFTHKNQHVPI